jgi:hypothetical protein
MLVAKLHYMLPPLRLIASDLNFDEIELGAAATAAVVAQAVVLQPEDIWERRMYWTPTVGGRGAFQQ